MAELIVALDAIAPADVDDMLRRLGDTVDFYKVGLELFCAGGPEVVRRLARRRKRVFLDLKLHDIPRTVGRAVLAAAALEVEMLTVHAAGGRAMVAAAVEAAKSRGAARPRILAVTVLTSLAADDLAECGVARPPDEQAAALARLAIAAGADGVVCSPLEAGRRRARRPGEARLVTPGGRPAGAARDDQRRVATPAAAVRAGATHLVVGRPVLDADDPAAAARAILAEMRP